MTEEAFDEAVADVVAVLNSLLQMTKKMAYDRGFEAGFNEANDRSDEDGEQTWTRGYLDGVDDARRDPKFADEMVGVIVRWQVAQASEQMDDADLRDPVENANVEGGTFDEAVKRACTEETVFTFKDENGREFVIEEPLDMDELRAAYAALEAK
jgi:hypothetical protein